ncbi:DUF2778 domain-containing protein [Caulobacter segnis]|uniref:Tlde1 domain-containing protein n=2 Tax=Caulobacter segnis TaxID=88688 RepID=D5VLN1_CAUST|nr:tlde1 domain-containing protein [Caulobacter segnis]ADG11404.1 conserved hypothetical protein [Caulobacter segnis ATCC 21756]AVQ03071.1 DUF2778 domain-containing protein [Caulobacter segnis]
MTWTWDQSAGTLSRDGKLVSRGYSGNGRGKNNPTLEGMPGIGPIPAGRYRIGAPYDSGSVGPYTLVLDAIDANPGDDIDQRTGRGAFRIHGDSIKAPGTASKGCIILPRVVRELIWKSGDRDLVVTA